MAEIQVNAPPPTYDILGLNEAEMKFLVNLIGRSSGDLSYGIYRKIPPYVEEAMQDDEYFGKSLPREITPRPVHEIKEHW